MSEGFLSVVSDPVAAYDFASKKLNYELSQTISRNNFFMVFQGVVIVGFLSVMGSKETPFYLVIISSFFGLALSYFQYEMACSGRKCVLQAMLFMQAREYDLLNALPDESIRYRFFTGDPRTRYRALNSSSDYSNVVPLWSRYGFKNDPGNKRSFWDIDNFNYTAKMIMRSDYPSMIAIKVSIVIFLFWLSISFFNLISLVMGN